MPITGFKNDSLKDQLAGTVLPKLDPESRYKPCVCVCVCVCVMYLHNSKRPFELFKSVSDTSHFERRETYKMINLLKGTIDTSSNHAIYLFKCKQCQYAFPYVGSTKTNFRYRTNNCKSTHRKFRKN